MKHLLPLLVALTVLCSKSANAQLFINEYSASNLNQFQDDYGKYEDWFEIYNAGSAPVNLTGYYLSDDSTNVTKWQIPSGSIAANGFARFWTSGRSVVNGTHYHTNFKLTQTKNNSEQIVLSDPSGTIIDNVHIKKTMLGHSRGRMFDGFNFWTIFTTPTVNVSNFTAQAYYSYAEKPSFSVNAGFYTSAQTVTITSTEPTNHVIRYTTDGTLPVSTSPLYTGPITISTTTVLKARAFSTDPNVLPGWVRFETIFINSNHTIPVISIAGNQLKTLANGNSSLKPHGTFEYFNVLGQRKATTYGEFNEHGQDSWVLSQRSLDFISRDEMGYNHSVEDQLFGTLTPRKDFQRVILRAAGDDNFPADYRPANAGSAHVRDAYIHNLALQGGMRLDVRTATKTIVYINGEYWGVYDIREKVTDHDFTDYYYGQDKYNLQMVLTWGNTWAKYGGNQAITDWLALYNYIMNNSMTDPVHYQYVDSQLDFLSLIDYVLVNMFTVCSDWLNWNTCRWRGMNPAGGHTKWGYTLWDNDATFDHYINYTGIPNTQANAAPCDVNTLTFSDPQKNHIGMLNKLMTNPDFYHLWVTRQVDIWNSVFSCDNMLTQLDSIVAVIDPEMQQHSQRWSGNYVDWQNNVQTLRNYISTRCLVIAGGFINCWNLTGPYALRLETDTVNAGYMELNSLVIDSLPWSGIYFGNINTNLKVYPDSGLTFVNWSSTQQAFNPNNTSVNVTFDLSSSDTIVAHFTTLVAIQDLLNPGTQPSVTAYPTIFNNGTTIEYFLPEKSNVSIKLFSLNGQEMAKINTPEWSSQPGSYAVQLDMKNTKFSPGIYFLEFTAGSFRESIKLIYAE
jgi:hypothetical protein